MASVVSCVQDKNIQQLRIILSGPVSEEQKSKALGLACRDGLLDAAKCLLEAGTDPNCTDDSGNQPLYQAVKSDHIDVTETLCKAGANVNAKGAGGTTPLHVAAKAGYDECLEILLDYGCQIDAKDSSGNTALILAVRHKQYLAIRALLAAGCDVNAYDRSGRTALHYSSHTAVAVDRLIEAGADVNIRDNYACTPLLLAATEGLDLVVHSLTQVPGCDVNLANFRSMRTPLHLSAYKGHARGVQDILAVPDCDINLLDSDNKSALWFAVDNGKLEVTATLLKSPKLQFSCEMGLNEAGDMCPVRQAVIKQRLDILKLFILCGYDNIHLRDLLAKSDVQALFQEQKICHWLELGQGVSSLRHLCRIWLRHQFGPSLDLRQLRQSLPEKLVNYLCFKELDDFRTLVKA